MSENETAQPSESSGTAPKPTDMPGAIPTEHADPNPVAPEGEQPEPEGEGLSELERLTRALGGPEGLRSILQEERRWERKAKALQDKARKFDEIEESKKSLEERLISERDDTKRQLEAERLERQRERIARETGVPPEQINGSDEDAMRESAEKALAWANSLRKAQAGSAPPASTVTGDGNAPSKPGQIMTREELKSMTPQQILAADKEGRLDQMKGIGV